MLGTDVPSHSKLTYCRACIVLVIRLHRSGPNTRLWTRETFSLSQLVLSSAYLYLVTA